MGSNIFSEVIANCLVLNTLIVFIVEVFKADDSYSSAFDLQHYGHRFVWKSTNLYFALNILQTGTDLLFIFKLFLEVLQVHINSAALLSYS